MYDLLFQLYGEYFDKEMFAYVLNLIYNLPKTDAFAMYDDMTDKPNEIQLGKKKKIIFSYFAPKF